MKMKRYIVFIKQVPLSTKVEMDPVRKNIEKIVGTLPGQSG